MVDATGRPGSGLLLELTFAVISAANLLMTLLVYRFELTAPENAGEIA